MQPVIVVVVNSESARFAMKTMTGPAHEQQEGRIQSALVMGKEGPESTTRSKKK